MNWYKKIKIATSRTLYHGTSINNYDSMNTINLEEQQEKEDES